MEDGLEADAASWEPAQAPLRLSGGEVVSLAVNAADEPEHAFGLDSDLYTCISYIDELKPEGPMIRNMNFVYIRNSSFTHADAKDMYQYSRISDDRPAGCGCEPVAHDERFSLFFLLFFHTHPPFFHSSLLFDGSMNVVDLIDCVQSSRSIPSFLSSMVEIK